jgi:hypothetical protein
LIRFQIGVRQRLANHGGHWDHGGEEEIIFYFRFPVLPVLPVVDPVSAIERLRARRRIDL